MPSGVGAAGKIEIAQCHRASCIHVRFILTIAQCCVKTPGEAGAAQWGGFGKDAGMPKKRVAEGTGSRLIEQGTKGCVDILCIRNYHCTSFFEVPGYPAIEA